jgi:hypothetical protein
VQQHPLVVEHDTDQVFPSMTSSQTSTVPIIDRENDKPVDTPLCLHIDGAKTSSDKEISSSLPHTSSDPKPAPSAKTARRKKKKRKTPSSAAKPEVTARPVAVEKTPASVVSTGLNDEKSSSRATDSVGLLPKNTAIRAPCVEMQHGFRGPEQQTESVCVSTPIETCVDGIASETGETMLQLQTEMLFLGKIPCNSEAAFRTAALIVRVDWLEHIYTYPTAAAFAIVDVETDEIIFVLPIKIRQQSMPLSGNARHFQTGEVAPRNPPLSFVIPYQDYVGYRFVDRSCNSMCQSDVRALYASLSRECGIGVFAVDRMIARSFFDAPAIFELPPAPDVCYNEAHDRDVCMAMRETAHKVVRALRTSGAVH